VTDRLAVHPFRPAPITRRAMLRTSLAGIATLAAGGCALGPGSSAATLIAPGQRRLAPVRVSAERVIRATAGLRPFRAPGFVVKAERFDETTVVHNYGHGGGGITLSWGSSDLAAGIVGQTGQRRVAVIGAGVMGLTTARLLQDRGHDVTIYARELTPNTTSNMSGGQWNPTSVADFNQATPAFVDQFQRATRFAWRYFQNLAGPRYGVRWVENYVLLNSPPPEGLTGIRELVPEIFAEWTLLEPGEHPFHTPYARRYITMLVEPAIFLDTLSHDFLLRGGRIEVREFSSVAEIVALEEPVVVNCTGIGAHALFGDSDLVPVKGQLAVLVPQPEVDYIVISGSFYAFPRSDGVVLGGSNERGNWSLDTDPDIIQRIVDGNRATFTGME
jgi:D-amino-acid oxidase